MKNSALKKFNQRGFTLIEMLMVILFFSILGYSIITIVGEIFKYSRQQSLALNVADQARKTSFNFASELRNATTGNDGSYSLNQAGDTQIIFYTGKNTGAIVNRVRYYLTGDTLYKGVVVPSGNPLFYNLASETITPVQTNLANAATPVFYYYDGDYDGATSPLGQPININQVKFVKINLVILNEPGISSSVGTSTISAGATIRNLKTNLGD
jgi:prepilin-type N-terminal cleavage/methylation domain-containing protein